MVRVTGFGKFLGVGLGVFIGLAASFASAPHAQINGDKPGGIGVPVDFAAKSVGADAAAIIAYLQALIPILQAWFMEYLTQEVANDILVGKGDSAVVEQVAANTLGVQQALQQHAGTMVETIAQQTVAMETAVYNRTFGTLMNMNVGGQTISVGGNAPSACRRTSDAQRLQTASALSRRNLQQTDQNIDRHSQGYGTYGGFVAHLRNEMAQYGGEVFDFGFMQRDTVDANAAERMQRAITYSLTPEPVPSVPQGSRPTPAVQEYEVRVAQHRELSKVPAQIVARQNALRVGAEGQNGRSYLEIVRAWAKEGIESQNRPIELQAKTEAGLLREIQLTQNALLWVQTEQLQTQQEQTLLLALLAKQQLETQGQALAAQHARLIRQD